VRLATTRQAWQRWLAAAGPWQGWSVCPTLLAPAVEDVGAKPARRPAARQVAKQLAETLKPGGVLVTLDLEPVLGVHVAALLNQRQLANAVLLLPRWPYPQATLPVDQLVQALVSQAQRLAPREQLANVVFVLDAQRNRPLPHRPASDGRADNRYRLSVADLPDLAALRAHGIHTVVKLSAA
jgi:hypothetical protein